MGTKKAQTRVGIIATVFILLFMSGCAHTYQPGIISLQEIDCASCGFMIVEELNDTANVKEVNFNKQKAEVNFQYDAEKTNPETIIKDLDWTQYKIASGPGQGSYSNMREFESTIDVQHISKAGEMVDIYKHVVPGKFTVMDFYATWCGPCRQADEFFDKLLHIRHDIALRKINIVDWDSPVAKHYLKDATEIPYMIIIDASGNEVARLSGYKPAELKKLLQVK